MVAVRAKVYLVNEKKRRRKKRLGWLAHRLDPAFLDAIEAVGLKCKEIKRRGGETQGQHNERCLVNVVF